MDIHILNLLNHEKNLDKGPAKPSLKILNFPTNFPDFRIY